MLTQPAVLKAVTSSQLPEVSVDLVASSYRSDTFPQDWSREERERSFKRYRQWLKLKVLDERERLAPTRDIDLFWHLHMLSPVAYHRDCMRLFGRLLDHDGGFGKTPAELEVLKKVFTRTAERFEATFGEPYREDGVFMRDAEMTSCWHYCNNYCWHACNEVQS